MIEFRRREVGRRKSLVEQCNRAVETARDELKAAVSKLENACAQQALAYERLERAEIGLAMEEERGS